MLNIESKRAAEPKHRQQTRIERDGTERCSSCTSSCTPLRSPPSVSSSDEIDKTPNSCYANRCSTVARPASRAAIATRPASVSTGPPAPSTRTKCTSFDLFLFLFFIWCRV